MYSIRNTLPLKSPEPRSVETIPGEHYKSQFPDYVSQSIKKEADSILEPLRDFRLRLSQKLNKSEIKSKSAWTVCHKQLKSNPWLDMTPYIQIGSYFSGLTTYSLSTFMLTQTAFCVGLIISGRKICQQSYHGFSFPRIYTSERILNLPDSPVKNLIKIYALNDMNGLHSELVKQLHEAYGLSNDDGVVREHMEHIFIKHLKRSRPNTHLPDDKKNKSRAFEAMDQAIDELRVTRRPVPFETVLDELNLTDIEDFGANMESSQHCFDYMVACDTISTLLNENETWLTIEGISKVASEAQDKLVELGFEDHRFVGNAIKDYLDSRNHLKEFIKGYEHAFPMHDDTSTDHETPKGILV